MNQITFFSSLSNLIVQNCQKSFSLTPPATAINPSSIDTQYTFSPGPIAISTSELRNSGGRYISSALFMMPAMELDSGDRDKELFVEVNPSGRYGRYSELLGSGVVKKVYRAFDQEEGIEVAWNQVKLRNFCHDQSMMERLYSEVKLLTSLKNKNIITL